MCLGMGPIGSDGWPMIVIGGGAFSDPGIDNPMGSPVAVRGTCDLEKAC